MKFELELKPSSQLISERGLDQYGKAQKFIDSECIRLMGPYTPMLSGALTSSATQGTKIGSGEINQIAPYARYQYYGKLMVSSTTGSSYATHGEKKVLTDHDLTYNTSKHPKAGKMWFERFKSDYKAKLLKNVQKIANKKG